jgi:hypothetical protein
MMMDGKLIKHGARKMNQKEKILVLKEDLILITDTVLRTWAAKATTHIPDYFFTTAASSTGKYHPKFSLGIGGLLRHTRAALKIAEELFNNHTVQNFTDEEKDCIRISILFHDAWKHGLNYSKYTKSDHAQIAMNELITLFDIITPKLSKKQREIITGCVLTHMGEWNILNYKTKETYGRRPENEFEKFVHLCDYLASRKFLDVKFDENNNIIS